MTRSATLEDFNFVYNLYMHPQVNPFLLYENTGQEEFYPIFEALVLSGVKFIYGNERESMGMFKLVPMLHRNHHIVYLGGLAIHPVFAGKGTGSKMLKEIVDLAEKRGFLRIELSVSVANEKAIRLYEKTGFKQEGILRKFTHLQSENRFVDEVLMAFIY